MICSQKGIPIQPLPLLHGGDYISLGFAFGDTDPFVYLSDVKAVPDDTMFRLRNLGPIQTLVVDALHRKKHPTHFDLDDAIQLVRRRETKSIGKDHKMEESELVSDR